MYHCHQILCNLSYMQRSSVRKYEIQVTKIFNTSYGLLRNLDKYRIRRFCRSQCNNHVISLFSILSIPFLPSPTIFSAQFFIQSYNSRRNLNFDKISNTICLRNFFHNFFQIIQPDRLIPSDYFYTSAFHQSLPYHLRPPQFHFFSTIRHTFCGDISPYFFHPWLSSFCG